MRFGFAFCVFGLVSCCLLFRIVLLICWCLLINLIACEAVCGLYLCLICVLLIVLVFIVFIGICLLACVFFFCFALDSLFVFILFVCWLFVIVG